MFVHIRVPREFTVKSSGQCLLLLQFSQCSFRQRRQVTRANLPLGSKSLLQLWNKGCPSSNQLLTKAEKLQPNKLTPGTQQHSVLLLQVQSLGSTSRDASCWLIVQRGSEGQAQQQLHLGSRQIERLTGGLMLGECHSFKLVCNERLHMFMNQKHL